MSSWRGDNNPGHQRRIEKWAVIEAEFGEPVTDVIQGLREQGNSWRTVAGCLDVSLSTLAEWRKALGLPLDTHCKKRDPSSTPELTPCDLKAIAVGYENMQDAQYQESEMKARDRIEREFDQSLAEIIMGLRQQGCTWRSVALALEVSRTRVYQFRRELGLPINEPRIHDDLSKYPRKMELAASELGYRNAREAVIDLRLSGNTIAQTAETLGIHPRTVTRHYPADFAGTVFVKTEKYQRTRNRGGNWGWADEDAI